MSHSFTLLMTLALSHLAVFCVSGETRAADPVAGVFSRMTPGVHVGHFDHDQDEEQVAAVNADYLNSVKSAGFKSIRIFCTTDKAPAFYAPNIQHALTNGQVVNLCLFAWDYNTKTKEAFAAHWKAVAECYKDYPDELVFELFNEPALSPKLTNAAVVMEWINAGITAIRKVSPQRILLVGGPQFMEAEFLSRYVTPTRCGRSFPTTPMRRKPTKPIWSVPSPSPTSLDTTNANTATRSWLAAS